MLKNKTSFKISIALGIMLLVMLLLGTTKVNATNISDEEYVKGLKLTSPKYYEVDLDFLNVDWDNETEFDNTYNKFFDMITNYYEKQVNDSTIKISATAGAGGTDGGLNLWSWEQGTILTISRNGTEYDTRIIGHECTIPVITVPSNITDSELNSYLKTLITSKYNEFGSAITSIVQGIKDTELPNITNGYTVYSDYGITSYIIVNREKATINKEDKTTNIKLDTDTSVVPENTILNANKLTNEKTLNVVKESLKDISTKYVSYDITLKSNGVAIQPNGKVKISIPIPTDYDKTKLAVYRIADDGTKTKYDIKVTDNLATFETDHFSTYILAENNVTTDNTNNQETPNTPNTNNKTDKEKDNTPKTGKLDIINYVLVITALAGVGIIVFKKYSK